MTELPADLTASLLRIQARTLIYFWKSIQPLPPLLSVPHHLISKVRFKRHQFEN